MAADKIDFVETDESLSSTTLVEYPVVESENIVEVKPVKIKHKRKSKDDDGVVDISDITL